MTKAEQIARLALARAVNRGVVAIVATDHQRFTINLIRSIDPTVVLTLVGTTGVRIWGRRFGGDGPNKAAA